ncbi:MAG: hypothetical protein M3Y87_35745, partial [Myxococcota bacterium]|nr:hypothetical protein [Myxococcota bacterium]
MGARLDREGTRAPHSGACRPSLLIACRPSPLIACLLAAALQLGCDGHGAAGPSARPASPTPASP